MTLIFELIIITSYPYSAEQLAFIGEIAGEGAALYPAGTICQNAEALRHSVRSWAAKKGFAVTNHGTSILCSRCSMPNAERKKLEKKAAAVPEGKRRQRKTTRVGCPFKINCSKVDRKNREDKRVIILPSSEFAHSGGCIPSRNQLSVEKRKSGAYTVAANEFHIKSILNCLKTRARVNNGLLREMMKPLFPAGVSLDTKMFLISV